MSGRRRHSKAFDALDEASFGEYRRLCLLPEQGGAGARLEQIVAWLGAQGVAASDSAVGRDSQYFRSVHEATERVRTASAAAEEIVRAAAAGGGIAATQSAAVEVFTGQVLDLLMQQGAMSIEDIHGWAKMGQSLARLTGSQIAVYRAEVEARAREAADKASAIAAESAPDVQTRLDALAQEILGVAG